MRDEEIIRVVDAKLIKRVTDDGMIEVEDHVELGRKYIVNLDSRRTESGFNTIQEKHWTREVIDVIDVDGDYWWPTELLEIDES